MLPFERLRSIARSPGIADQELAIEVAECFAHYPIDSAQLVMIARRLLSHRRSCGALWWVCSRVVVATDPQAAALEAIKKLESDPTATRLSASLPFPADSPVAALGWTDTIHSALVDRTDLDVVVIPRSVGDKRLAQYLNRLELPFRVGDDDLSDPSHLLVEATVASPTLAQVPIGTIDLKATYPRAALWLVLAQGCLVPDKMYAVAVAEPSSNDRLNDLENNDYEQIEITQADRIATPVGIITPERVSKNLDCPVAPELLRL